jgi:stage IV sporulation protein FB
VRWSIPIGWVKGTVVRLHFTFILFLAWIGVALFAQGGMQAALGGIGFLLLLFLCVVLHEFGHILAARHFGIHTPEVLLLPIGGVSRLERIPERPREELFIALAGPAVSLAIAAALVAILGGFPGPAEILAAPSGRSLLAQLAFANLGLLIFNLFPAFPMDGGRVLRAILSARFGHLRGTRIAARTGQLVAVLVGMIALMTGQVLLVAICFFVYLAAGSEAGLAQVRAATAGIPAGEVMVTIFESLAADAPLVDAAEALIRTSQLEFPIVDGNGRFVGLLTRSDIVKAMEELGANAPVARAMQTDIPLVARWDHLDGAFDMLQHESPAVGVIDPDGRLVGLITRENLLEKLMLSQARTRHVRGAAKRIFGPPSRGAVPG